MLSKEEILLEKMFMRVSPADFVGLAYRARIINDLLSEVDLWNFKQLLRKFVKDVVGVDIAADVIQDGFFDGLSLMGLTNDEKYVLWLFIEKTRGFYFSRYYLRDYIHDSAVVKFSLLCDKLKV